MGPFVAELAFSSCSAQASPGVAFLGSVGSRTGFGNCSMGSVAVASGF